MTARTPGWSASGLLLLLLLLGSTAPVAADRYEATVEVRPRAGLARAAESTSDGTATTTAPGGGVDVAVGYGLRNGLDVGILVGATALAAAIYDDVTLAVGGNPRRGTLTRTTRAAQLQVGGTLRLGVGLVPSVSVFVGPALRQRGAATFRVPANPAQPDGPTVVVPLDIDESGTTLELAATARLGLDYRLTRRWSLGAAASVVQHVGSAPLLTRLEAGLTLAYRWYPHW